MGTTNIEWTATINPDGSVTKGMTWNPTSGCTRCSPGCANCYAFELHDMRHAAYKAGKSLPIQYAKPFNELQLFEDRLGEPLKWQKPKRVFVDSMSDLFHEDVPDSFIRKAFGVMSTAGQHTFQILTKRAGRMAAWFANPANSLANCQAEMVLSEWWQQAIQTPTGRSRYRDLGAINGAAGHRWPLPNVWLGVSVENQAMANKRIPKLIEVPASLRFLSCEPLLGPLDIRRYLPWVCPPLDEIDEDPRQVGYPSIPNDLDLIRWVIAGGESGPDARPMHSDWARSIRDQCQASGVPFFFKQWGEWAPLENHHVMVPSGNYSFTPSGEKVTVNDKRPKHVWMIKDLEEIGDHECFSAVRVGKKAAGRLLDGREWNEFPTSSVKV